MTAVTELGELVQDLVARHGIPGAVVGVLDSDALMCHARFLFLSQFARRVGDT